jgi:hypothetical protein
MKGKQNRGSEIQVEYIGNTDDLGSAGQSGDSARGQSSQIQSGVQSGSEQAQGQSGQLNRGQGDSARGQSSGQGQGESVQADYVGDNELSSENQGNRSYE